MIYIVLILLSILGLIIHRLNKNSKFLQKKFKDESIIVYGIKGAGKDVLFQHLINKDKKHVISNIKYKEDMTVKDFKSIFDLKGNTYLNLITDNILTVEKVKEFENSNVYISDAGIYFPSQHDAQLTKYYPSFPVYYALSRHLYNQQIHMNTQALNRVWLKIREQAGGYIRAVKTINIGIGLITRCIYYENYDTALKNILPINKLGMIMSNNYNKAQIEQHKATYGTIKPMFIFTPKYKLKYDSRHFHEKVFGYPFKPAKRK